MTADQQDPRCDYCGDRLSEHTPMQVESCLGDLYEQLNGPRMTQRRNDEGPGINDTGAQHAEALLLRRENDGSTQQDPRVDILAREAARSWFIGEQNGWTGDDYQAWAQFLLAKTDAARPASPAPVAPDREALADAYVAGAEKALNRVITRGWDFTGSDVRDTWFPAYIRGEQDHARITSTTGEES